MADETLIDHPHSKPVLEYPCGEPPAVGSAREVAPGLLWLRMPLPFTLTHINLWAVRDGDGWAIFDSGVRTSDTASAWYKLLGEGGALDPGRLTRLFVTHMHPDHVGMAGWLSRKFGCRLWMTRMEYFACRVLMSDMAREAPADATDFYRAAGWDEAAIDTYRARFGGFGKLIYTLPDSYRRIADGDELRIGEYGWRVVSGRGHSPEHACFYSEELKVLISGDQVLPRISSNVSVFPMEPDADPMGDWLHSLDKLQAEIPDDVLVLPAHNEPFRGLHARLDDLRRSQFRALERLRRSLGEPRRAVDVFGQLFGRPITSEPQLLGLATGESVAHLNYLLHRGQAVRELDAHGVAWYRAPITPA